MKKIIFSLICLSALSIPVSFANPAPQNEAMFPIQSVTLTYDIDKANLHVDAAHPSNNWERDFVRMMTVSLNGQEVSTLNYYHQKKAEGFSDDVQLNAKVGDVISVTVYCTQGSSLSQDLTVTQSSASSDQGANANAGNTTDNAAN